MEKKQATNLPQAAACQAFHHPPAHFATGESADPRRSFGRQGDCGNLGSYPAAAAAMIAPAAAALVIACALSPAITFVVLRSKGYSPIAASLGVAAGALGLLIAIAAPSHRPAN